MSLLFFAGGECLERHGTLVWRQSQSQDNVATFTRSGTTGWHRGADGYLRNSDANIPRVEWIDGSAYLTIEAAGTNEILQSEDLNTTWSTTNASINTNTATGPDGATTLDTIIENSTASVNHGISQALTGLTADADYAFSMWFTANTRSWVRMQFQETAASANYVRAWFNLSTGAVGTTGAGGTGTFERAYVERVVAYWNGRPAE